MNLKFNLGILRRKCIVFNWIDDDREFLYEGVIDSVKNKKNCYIVTFENGNKMNISDIALARCKIRENNDGKVIISYNPSETKFSGFVGFSMSDTYGFPIEMTKEILIEDGYEIDMDGYEVLKRLQKEFASGTYKNKDGWDSK